VNIIKSGRGLVSRYLGLLILSMPLILNAQIKDQYIANTISRYFARNRTAPPLISAELSNDYLYGRTLKIRIQGRRTQENEDIGFAFGAAASIANQTSLPIQTLWVEMDVRYKSVEMTTAIAPADCSIDTIVRKTKSFGTWWQNCLEFL